MGGVGVASHRTHTHLCVPLACSSQRSAYPVLGHYGPLGPVGIPLAAFRLAAFFPRLLAAVPVRPTVFRNLALMVYKFVSELLGAKVPQFEKHTLFLSRTVVLTFSVTDTNLAVVSALCRTPRRHKSP